MTDVLIRNVPDDVLRRIDDRARRLGLSRTDYLRREIARTVATSSDADLTVDIFFRFDELAIDLVDDEVMEDAWS